MRRLCGLLAVALAVPVYAYADDPWEFPTDFPGGATDDGIPTNNGLTHGTTQRHDLQGAGSDVDIGFVLQRPYRSYEARIVDTQTCWVPSSSLANCAHFDRVDGAQAVLQGGVAFDGSDLNGIAVRWETTTISGSAYTWIRAVGLPGHGGLDSQYELQFFDTTYTAPRWNNSGGQVTVFLIQSANGRPVVGSIHFLDAAGNVIATAALNVPAMGLQVVPTSTVGGLAGLSGSAVITHTGEYGSLSGKAVALEPSTGFSFDTPFSPLALPR